MPLPFWPPPPRDRRGGRWKRAPQTWTTKKGGLGFRGLGVEGLGGSGLGVWSLGFGSLGFITNSGALYESMRIRNGGSPVVPI